MDQLPLIVFVVWPAVVLACAGINMLVSWTFSWSELIFDYLIGVVAGLFLFLGTRDDPETWISVMFVFSHGLFALLWWVSDGFREVFGDAAAFIGIMALIRVVSTAWAAGWDRLSAHLGCHGVGPALFALVVAPAKLPYAWATSAVGLLIWLGGLVNVAIGPGRVALAGGTLCTEFMPGSAGYSATTLGFTIHCWSGKMPFAHELYHTRQYIYMGDWLIPFWLLGCVWGAISTAIAGRPVDRYAMFAADTQREIGNPLEVAAYHL